MRQQDADRDAVAQTGREVGAGTVGGRLATRLCYVGQGRGDKILIIKMKRRLNEVYVKHTGRTYDEVENTLDRDHFMESSEAKEWGLIDRILTSRAEIEGAAPSA